MSDGRQRATTGPTWRRRLVAATIGVLAALVLGELTLRVIGFRPTYINPLQAFHTRDPDVGWAGKRSFVGRLFRSDFDVVIAHDADGFRQHEHENTAAPRSVFVLGDSFTWGWGVSQGAVFTDRMNELMPGVRVRNFGLNASATVHQLLLFRKFVADAVQPGDVVLLLFYENDFAGNLEGSVGVEVEGDRVLVGPVAAFGGDRLRDELKDVSYLYNLCALLIDQIKQQRALERSRRAAVDLSHGSRELVAARHLLMSLRQEVEACGAMLLVARIPSRIEYGEVGAGAEREREIARAFRAAFEECAGAAGVRCVDLLGPMLRAKTTDDRWLTFPQDEHWNERGHAIVAQALADALRSQETSRVKR